MTIEYRGKIVRKREGILKDGFSLMKLKNLRKQVSLWRFLKVIGGNVSVKRDGSSYPYISEEINIMISSGIIRRQRELLEQGKKEVKF